MHWQSLSWYMYYIVSQCASMIVLSILHLSGPSSCKRLVAKVALLGALNRVETLLYQVLCHCTPLPGALRWLVWVSACVTMCHLQVVLIAKPQGTAKGLAWSLKRPTFGSSNQTNGFGLWVKKKIPKKPRLLVHFSFDQKGVWGTQ